jgi:hypothetical protein
MLLIINNSLYISYKLVLYLIAKVIGIHIQYSNQLIFIVYPFCRKADSQVSSLSYRKIYCYCIDFITVHRYVFKLHMAVFKSIYCIYPSVLWDSRRIIYCIHIKFTYTYCYSVYILPLTTICQSGLFIYCT